MAIVGPRVPQRTFGHVFDSSIAAWIPDPKTSAAGGAGSTQVAVSSVAGIVATSPASTVWASSAGFHFDSSGGLLVSPPASTTVAVSSVSGTVAVLTVPAASIARSSVTQSSTNVTLQAANTARRMWLCYNRPTQNANLFLKWGATASTSDFDVMLAANAYFEMPRPVYTGRIDGIWDSTGVGFARISEWT